MKMVIVPGCLNTVNATKEDAIAYCAEHRNEFLSDCYASGEDGQRQYDCLIACLESGTIKPEELAAYGMDYPRCVYALRAGGSAMMTISSSVRRVASLELPIPVKSLKGMVDALEAAYGLGLTMRQEPRGWLCIETPNTKGAVQ